MSRYNVLVIVPEGRREDQWAMVESLLEPYSDYGKQLVNFEDPARELPYDAALFNQGISPQTTSKYDWYQDDSAVSEHITMRGWLARFQEGGDVPDIILTPNSYWFEDPSYWSNAETPASWMVLKLQLLQRYQEGYVGLVVSCHV